MVIGNVHNVVHWGPAGRTHSLAMGRNQPVGPCLIVEGFHGVCARSHCVIEPMKGEGANLWSEARILLESAGELHGKGFDRKLLLSSAEPLLQSARMCAPTGTTR